MRTVVAAPYPTMPGPEASATFAMVRGLVDAGDEVIVVSPRPSAAHHHADPGSPRGALALARIVGATDNLLLRLDAGGVAAHADPLPALPGRLALAAVLRRAARVELILDRVPATVSRRWVALVASAATIVRVSSEAERESLVRGGVEEARVAIDPELVPLPTRTSAVYAATIPSTAEAIEAHIKAHAHAMSPPGATGRAANAALPLRGVVPLERPTELSRKPGVATVKRLQLRLLGWMFDAVAGHVNRLQQAVIESIESMEAIDAQRAGAAAANPPARDPDSSTKRS